MLTVPQGFSIDSFVPSPGWTRVLQQTGSGDSAVIQKVTWTGGHVPTGEDSLFQFLGQPAKTGTYTFQVEQTYSDGSIVNWATPSRGANPAPTIEAKSSLGGGGTPLLTIVALVVGAVGVILGVDRPRLRRRRREEAARMRRRGRVVLVSIVAVVALAVPAARLGARLPDQDVPVGERRSSTPRPRMSR